MGGLACAKHIIDNGAGAVQFSATGTAAIHRALSCMSNSILLGSVLGNSPTEEMEKEFLAATEDFKKAMSAAADPLLEVAGRIANHCFPEG